MQIVSMYYNENLQHLGNKNHIKKILTKKTLSRRTKKLIVFVWGNLLYCQNVLAASPSTAKSVAKIDKAGNMLLGLCRNIGYWICIIMCINEIIKNMIQGDTKAITKIMMKYSLIFASLYIFPWILNLIKEIFI